MSRKISNLRFKFMIKSISSGKSLSNDMIEEKGNPIYGGGERMGYTSAFNAEENDILIGRVGARCGCVTYLDKKAWATDNALIIKPKYDARYVSLLLEAADLNSVVVQDSTAQPLVTGGKIKELSMPFVAELYEQRQIVSFLDCKRSAIDTAIEKTRESIEKLEEYKKAVITKAVTKGLDPDAKMKDSGVEWIGEVPETWNVKQLRKFYSRRVNKNKGLHEKNLLSLSYGNIIRKSIDTKEGLLPESFDGYNIVEANDIVIRGTDLQNDHRSLRTGLVTERGIITSAYMTLKPKAGVNSEYYHYLLHCYDIEKVFYSMGGGLRQSLDYWDFIRTYVLVPSEQEQKDIVEHINSKCASIDALIAKKQEVIRKLEEYKKSLIYYAVTGKIDCRDETV